jgi:rubredoxin
MSMAAPVTRHREWKGDVLARYQCPGCGYVYDEAHGDEHEGFSPGTPWTRIPENWSCPDCSVRDKPDFQRADTAVD